MYKKLLWISLAVVSAMLSLAAVVFLSATASAAPPAVVAPASPAGEGAPPSDYLIALPIFLPEPAEIPAGLTPEQAADYARRLTYRQARPVLAELERLQAEGKVAGFEVRPDLHSVAVQAMAPDALSRVQGAGGAMLAKGDEPPACAAAAADALVEQVLGLSQAAAPAPLVPQATDPSIDVYIRPGSDYTYVRGRTAFTATTVTMRILRQGQVIATQSTASNSGGYYSFYPSWQDCPTSGYNWTLQPGDVVEVTVGGSTVSTVVASLSAWVDPVANVVAGQTDAGRSAEVHLYHYDGLCSSTHFSQTVPADSGGSFSADFSSQVDFNRMAYSTIYARDANGNSTYASFYAYRIGSDFGSSYIYGYLKPEVSFTATLSRPGSLQLVPYTGQSDADGSYDAWFGVEIQPGDIIQVSGGGVSMQYTATSLAVALDHTTDQAAGATGANRRVKAWFYKRDTSYYLQTSCAGGTHCASAQANAGGSFAVTTTLDLARGDYGDFYVYDAERHYQYSSERPVTAIVAELGSRVMGYWGDPTAGYVTITIKSASGVVKYTSPWGVSVDSWDGEFSDWPWGITIVPSDTIEVTDGAMTETMTVQNFSARLDGSSGHLAGSAYDDHLLATLWDFRRESGGWWEYCAETDVVSEAYDLTFSGAQVGGQDDGEVWNTGPDGHYTYHDFHAFAVNAEKGSDYIEGFSETPNTAVTITLERGGSPLVVYTDTSSSDGYYGAYLSDVTPVTITQGDTVTVQTGDGDAASVPIPVLTANTDAVNNRVYGQSPASEPVEAGLRRHYNYGWYGYSRNTAAGASGDYEASFDGLYWWRDCSDVDAGHACSQPAVDYYNAAGHHIWLEGPLPQPVGPDGYENDDVYTSASAYTGVQSHTFHVVTDTDWVSFTVPAGDAGSAVYQIETINLGWGMDTVLGLYDTDGTTPIDYDDDSGEGLASLITWTPAATGTYYVLAEPYDEDNTAYCDAVYDLEISVVRAHIYLPLIIRNG